MRGYEIEIVDGGKLMQEITFAENAEVEVSIRLVDDRNVIVDKKTLVKSIDNKITFA